MSPPLTEWCNRLDEYGKTYIDGDYGLVIGTQPKDAKHPLWLAVTSFDLFGDGPRIKQLHAYTNEWSKDQDRQKEVMQNYRWEFGLVNLIALWADRVELSNVYIRGVANNAYKHDLGEERVALRYDVTAKRLGFLPDGDTGDYVLALKK